MGFAALENMIYLLGSDHMVRTVVARSLMSVLGHCCNAIWMGYFCASAIMGYATYDELKNEMKDNATADGSELTISMTDGYIPLLKQCNLSSPRLGGRILTLATHIIEERKGKEFVTQLLEWQTPFGEIIQTAYDFTNNDVQRDVMRKLLYLMKEKRTDHDNDNDSMLGRIEALALINTDIYSLLC